MDSPRRPVEPATRSPGVAGSSVSSDAAALAPGAARLAGAGALEPERVTRKIVVRAKGGARVKCREVVLERGGPGVRSREAIAVCPQGLARFVVERWWDDGEHTKDVEVYQLEEGEAAVLASLIAKAESGEDFTRALSLLVEHGEVVAFCSERGRWR